VNRPSDSVLFLDTQRAFENGLVSVSLRFNGHFSDGPMLADTRMCPFWILLELRMMNVVGHATENFVLPRYEGCDMPRVEARARLFWCTEQFWPDALIFTVRQTGIRH